jgi:xanthine dehydrogenase accessory factor
LAGSALGAALDSPVGYIGSVGSRKMQGDRADWLAYRGKTDLTRVRGPAGLDIGADSPEEIAVSIVAQAIAERASAGRLVGR